MNTLTRTPDMTNKLTTLGHPGLTGIIYADYDFDEPFLVMQIVGGDILGTDIVTFDGPFADEFASRLWGWWVVECALEEREPLMAGNAACRAWL